jgi:hypothetical protein
MSNDVRVVPCLICDEPLELEGTPLRDLAVCWDCALQELPAVLAQAVGERFLPQERACCAFQGVIDEFEREYWRSATACVSALLDDALEDEDDEVLE